MSRTDSQAAGQDAAIHSCITNWQRQDSKINARGITALLRYADKARIQRMLASSREPPQKIIDEIWKLQRDPLGHTVYHEMTGLRDTSLAVVSQGG